MASSDDDATYGFSQSDANDLIKSIGQRDYNVRLFEETGGGGPRMVHAYTPSGGIPARSTLTMGSATCDLYDCSSGGVLSDSGDNATIYNMASSAVAGSKHIVASRNSAGLLVAIVEDCG